MNVTEILNNTLSPGNASLLFGCVMSLVNEVDQRIREDAVKQLETAAREHWVKITFSKAC